MEYKIIESSRGGYVVNLGFTHRGGAEVDGVRGHTMPAFMVYESVRFDTLTEAKKFLTRRNKSLGGHLIPAREG